MLGGERVSVLRRHVVDGGQSRLPSISVPTHDPDAPGNKLKTFLVDETEGIP